MTLRFLRISAVSVLSTMLLASSALAQNRPAEPASPYGGVTVEDIIARVNDQIITRSDYNRAQKELDDEMRQRGATMQQTSEAHKDLLRNLIDQQLWLSKGKELGINGETELITRLNEIRKQYNLSTLEDLEKAAQEQGVSYDDFKANIRNQIVTQQVMRDQVGRHISFTPGEVQRFYDEHKQDFAQPENVKLSEILVSTGDSPDDAKVAAAKAKADDIEAKLKSGADFAQLARSSSDGQTASQGGDLGTYKRGQLAKVFEDATFGLKMGDVTDPIRTKQGFVIFKVVQHVPGGVPAFKDVEPQVEEGYYTSKMEPAIRDYLTKMREDAYIDIKSGFDDTGASTNKRVNPIAYSAYTPPSPKKRKKVERTRFRETAHFRQKGGSAAAPAETTPAVATTAATTTAATTPAKSTDKKKNAKATQQLAMKPGKKEKIRFGKAPTKTLPSEPQGTTENAGAVAQNNEPVTQFEETAPPEKKTRFSDRAKAPKDPKAKASKKDFPDNAASSAPDTAEVADRQTQSSALGLSEKSKKKKATATGEKTRLSERKVDESKDKAAPPVPTPIPAVKGAPAPAQPQTTQPQSTEPQSTPAPAPQPQQ